MFRTVLTGILLLSLLALSAGAQADRSFSRIKVGEVHFNGPDPVYNVMAKGAIGDGTTDDTVAIQTAIDLAVVGGGIVYFPCGKTFKFGTLDLSVIASPRGWITLLFCGTPKPTATIVMPQRMYAIEGVSSKTTVVGAFHKKPHVAFDLSAMTAGDDIIRIETANANPILLKNIGIYACNGRCLNITAGPVDVTLENVNLSILDDKDFPAFETSVGFGLYIRDSSFSGSLTFAQPSILSHGTGILDMDNVSITRRGIKVVVAPVVNNISLSSIRNVLAEGLIDDSLITIDNASAASCEDIWVGPNVKLADNIAGGGLYLIKKPAGGFGCKVNLIGMNAFSGFATAMTNGFGASDTVRVWADACTASTIGSTNFFCMGGSGITATGAASFGGATQVSGVTLTLNQTSTSAAALALKIPSGFVGDTFQSLIPNGTTPEMAFFSDTGTPTHGLRWWNNAGTFKADMRFGGTGPTADRLFTLPDATGHIPVLSASATTSTGTGDIVRATSPTLVTPVLGAATGTSVVLTADANARRFKAGGGTALVSGDFALSAGWGTTATVAVTLATSRDQAFLITVTSAGTGQLVNPTITLTFKDGTWTNTPVCIMNDTGGTGALADVTRSSSSATTYVWIWNALPVATSTYEFSGICMGT